MQIVPGIHKHCVINEGHFASEADEERYQLEENAIDLEVEEGEAVLLNNLLLHRSGVNPTGKQRRAFSAAYMDAGSETCGNRRDIPGDLWQECPKALRLLIQAIKENEKCQQRHLSPWDAR